MTSYLVKILAIRSHGHMSEFGTSLWRPDYMIRGRRSRDRRCSRSLAGLGGKPMTAPEDGPGSPMVILVAPGRTEAEMLHLCGADRRSPYEPVVLVAHPLHNSLPAALEAMAGVTPTASAVASSRSTTESQGRWRPR